MRENNSGFKIDESQRQSWLSIAAVWAGGMICVPCLMIGGVLAGGGLSLGQIVLSILIGYGLICVYMICIGMQACDTGLPVSVMASGALGEKGARYIISALLAIACVGWFGIQSATCGSAFASMVANMLGTEATPIFISISSIVWGVIMLLTACVGFKGLKWLNYIAVPLLVIVCLYGLIAGIVTNDGGSAITNYAPENSSGMVFGISMVVASFALGGVISADYCRFAKSRSDVVKSSVVGVIPAGLFMLLTGALMSIVTGQYDISAILASLGVPFVGLVALVLATWTTNVTNAYSGGLALSNLLGFDESKFKVTTGVAGAIGTLLAAFGLLNAFQSPHVCADPAAGRRADRLLLDCGQGQAGEFLPPPRFFRRRRHLFCYWRRLCLHHRRYLRQLPWSCRGSAVFELAVLCGPGQRYCGFSGPLCGPREADVRKADARKAGCVISAAGGAGICPLLLHTAIITKEGKGHAKNRNP